MVKANRCTKCNIRLFDHLIVVEFLLLANVVFEHGEIEGVGFG